MQQKQAAPCSCRLFWDTKSCLQVKLGLGGVEEVNGLGELSAVEQKGVDELIPILEGNIKKVCLLLPFKSAL